MSHSIDDEDDEERSSGRMGRIALTVALLLGAVAVVSVAKRYIGSSVTMRPSLQQVAILRQPPPPPPKPPEKPPEPPKPKEEIKVDTPTPEPKPTEPKPAEPPPAADKPLGVDADGSAGNDGFGLAANRGGRDLIGSGGVGGGSGAYYSGLLQRAFFDALTRNRKMLGDEFRVVVSVWIGDDGRVQRAEIIRGSGKEQVDELIQSTLAEMSPLREVPPGNLRQFQLRLSNHS